MFPGLPTSLSGAYVIESTVDEECQANLVTRLGKPFGCWLDDTTPDLEKWLALAVAKYRPLHQTVFVCVPPGEPHLRHSPSPPVVNLYEYYPIGEGVPESAWPPPPAYEGYVVQWDFPGTHSNARPSDRQRERLLAQVRALHPRFLFLF